MSEKRLKRRNLINKLFLKNRLVILNEDTFEEIFSFKLNLMNVFVAATLGAILLISSTTVIIAFTPFARVYSRIFVFQIKKRRHRTGPKIRFVDFSFEEKRSLHQIHPKSIDRRTGICQIQQRFHPCHSR